MSFLIKIYKYLYSNSWISSKPKSFFNQPIKKLDCQYRTCIWADVNFNIKERKLIKEALDDFHYFCNGCVELDIIFELGQVDSDIASNNYLIKANRETEIIKQYNDSESKLITTGLCVHLDKAKSLYLVTDELRNANEFKVTLVHELGHFIWLSHTEELSVMQKSNCFKAMFMNQIDAEEMAKVWGINPDHLRYFK